METNSNILLADNEFATKGSYKNSYFHIFLDGNFNENLRLMTQESFGFFVHEYIHYLQNITTIFGMKYSTYRYSTMYKMKSQIISSQLISLPIKIRQSQDEYNKTIDFQEALGTNNSYTWIDEESVSIHILKEDIENKERTKCEIHFKIPSEEKEQSVVFGAWHIKEGMSFMYQRFFDEDVNSDAIPYKLVEIIAKKKYPSIYEDKKKLICICYASLFDDFPAIAFFTLMELAENNPEFTGLDIVASVNNEVWIDKDGNENTNNNYMDEVVNEFKKELSKNLVANLDAIDEILNRVLFSKQHFPILTAMYDKNFPTRTIFLDIVTYYGYTYIQAANGYFFPTTVKGQKDFDDIGIKNNHSSDDVLELIAQSAIEQTLCSKSRECPLQYMCIEEDLVDEYCYKSPWLHQQCIYTVAADYLNLKQKIKS